MKRYIEVEKTEWHIFLEKKTGLSGDELLGWLIGKVPGIGTAKMATRVLTGASKLSFLDTFWLANALDIDGIDRFVSLSGMWPKDVAVKDMKALKKLR